MERVLQEIGRSPLIIAEIIISFLLFWIGQFAALTPKLCYPDQVHEENLAK